MAVRNIVMSGVILVITALIGFTYYSFSVPSNTQKDVSFEKKILSEVFVSEGVAVTDVNKDGQIDVLAGAWWWEAPNWEKHELAVPDTFTYDKGYSTTFLNFPLDVNQDGWTDLLRIDQPGEEFVWYENPGKKTGHWKMRMILPTAGNEAPAFVDVDGDGRKDIICNDNTTKQVIWIQAPVKKGDTTWKTYIISDDPELGTHKYTHGLGWGDVNGDGKKDVIINKGWWQGPADPKASGWKFHPAPLGPACADMLVYDVDGDRDMDIINSSAHDYGIWWYEQQTASDQSVSWTSHLIDSSFSQTHSLQLKDINGDGQPDLITGKRFYAHNGGDRGAHDPSMLYWYEFKPGKSPSWIPHQIDNNSGVGINFVVEDINKDKLLDIVVSNKKGVFVFMQRK